MRYLIFLSQNLLICIFLLSPFVNAQEIPACTTFVSSFPYHENFESSNGNWVSAGVNSDWEWGVPGPNKYFILQAGEGERCWIAGRLSYPHAPPNFLNWGYNRNEHSCLLSPCFDFSSISNPKISFKLFWETNKEDGANLEYSIDGGIHWAAVGDANSNGNCKGINWYNYPNILAASNTPGWAGTNRESESFACFPQAQLGSGGWVFAVHNLSFLGGQSNVRLRFTFNSGNRCTGTDGFAVDEVKIFNDASDFDYDCPYYGSVKFHNTSFCPLSVNWDFGDPLSSLNSSNENNPEHIFSSAGLYNVSLTLTSANGVVSTITKEILILKVSVLITNPVSCFGSNDAVLTVIVSGGGTNAGYSYLWNTNPPQSTQTITGLGAGDFIVTATLGNACPAYGYASLIKPDSLIVKPVVVPQRCLVNNGSILSNVTGGTFPYNYLWNTGQSTSAISNLPAGTYTLQVTDSRNCSVSVTGLNVTHIDVPVSVTLGPDILICAGETAILNPGSFATYLWQDNSVLPSYTATETSEYTVRIADENGCTGQASVHVTANCSDIYFPNSFTPNGDALNDYFRPIGDNLGFAEHFELSIYNRYGKLIFHSTKVDEGWDGKLNGKMQENNSFVWVAAYTLKGKQHNRKGTLLLLK